MLFLGVDLKFLPSVQAHAFWTDVSTTDYHIFVSLFGSVTLKRRVAYPTTFAYTSGSQLIFGYGVREEDKLGRPVRGDETYFFHDEFLVCSIDAFTARAEVRRDAFGTLPLFFKPEKDRLLISDDMSWIVERAATIHINSRALADLLFASEPNDYTLLQDLSLLPERSVLAWDNGETTLQSPQLLPPKAVDCDPYQFRIALEETLDAYWQKAAACKSAFDVSGGLDSAIMPLFIAKKYGGEFTMGSVLYPGDFGISQTAKLRDIQQQAHGQILSTLMSTRADFPLAQFFENGYEPLPAYHYSEIYRQPFRRVTQQMEQEGVEIVFTGVGGDELCENIPRPLETEVRIPSFYDPIESTHLARLVNEPHPPTLLARSSYLAGLSGNKLRIDHGIWPLAPLANPLLYFYTQGVDIAFRTNKNILRAFHKAHGFPRSIYQAGQNEDFGAFFETSVKENYRTVLEIVMQHSILEELGLTTKRAVVDAFERSKRQDSREDLFALFRLATAEIILQSQSSKLHNIAGAQGQYAER